jgi:hypothetical protein
MVFHSGDAVAWYGPGEALIAPTFRPSAPAERSNFFFFFAAERGESPRSKKSLQGTG